MKLEDRSRVAIVGGGPAGSMAGFFLQELAERVGMHLHVDLYESRDFSKTGPAGCNMCAGVVSETLVQTLAAEGINLPPEVVQKGIDSYILHTSGLNSVRIDTPAEELRIATVYRGSGPRAPLEEGVEWSSFDAYLLEIARQHGVNVIHQRVKGIERGDDGRPVVVLKKDVRETYDFLIGATGVNSPTLGAFEKLGFNFKPPKVSKGHLSEIHLGSELTRKHLGSSMHIFLLDIPGLKFAALIPKVEYVTVCLLGKDIGKATVAKFFEAPEVRKCFPPEVDLGSVDGCELGQACSCLPKLNLGPAANPYADRIALIGDAAVSRLYKDGIGAAYTTAKAAVVTAVFIGVSGSELKKHYAPVVNRITGDNRIGEVIFVITAFYQYLKFLRRGMVRMVHDEGLMAGGRRIMSRVLWDTFTGSATYREIFLRTLKPIFGIRLIYSTLMGILGFRKVTDPK